MSDVVFEVVGRSKTEKIVKGKSQVVYKVALKSDNGMHSLVLSDTDSALIALYPMETKVTVKIGRNAQTNLAKPAEA